MSGYAASLKSIRQRMRARFGQPRAELFADHAPAQSQSQSRSQLAPPPPADVLQRRLVEIERIDAGFGAALRELNAWQLAAVLADDRAVMVRAQVGSGKTTLLVQKILYLNRVQGVPLDRIIVLTFSCKAAREIQQRVGAVQMRWAGTFHAIARRLGNFGVIDPVTLEALWRELIETHGLVIRYERKLARRMEALAQGKLLYGNMRNPDDIEQLAELADEVCHELGLMDFDALLAHARDLLRRKPLSPAPRWILIDEFQDCDAAQLELLEALAGPQTQLFAVGDPNQVIYSWRGVSPGLFGRFEQTHGAVTYQLPVNYRSSGNILACARVFLRHGSELVGTREPGEPVRVIQHHNPHNEAIYLRQRLAELHLAGVPWSQMAVFVRTRSQLEYLHDMPCPCMTMHAAKGLEFDHVFLCGANDGLMPLGTDHAEEQRLFFVALTRARETLEISWYTEPDQQRFFPRPSPFLKMMPGNLVEWGKPQAQAQPQPQTSPAPDSWRVGESVRHAKYGQGEVTAVDGEALVAEFPIGRKRFSLRLCPLTRSD